MRKVYDLGRASHNWGPFKGVGLHGDIWGLGFSTPQIRGTFFGDPIVRIEIFWSLYWQKQLKGQGDLVKTGFKVWG